MRYWFSRAYDSIMRGKWSLPVLLVMFIILHGSTPLRAQDTTSADGLFDYARKTAYEQQDYPAAIRLAQKALSFNPNYTDVIIFIGRVYTWSKNTDSAKWYLTTAIAKDPKNEDGYLAYSDLDYWNNHHNEALITITSGRTMFPRSEELLLRQAKVLLALHRYPAALAATDTLLQLNKNNAEARELNVRLKELSAKNKLAINTEYTHFDKQFPDDWRFASIEYVNESIGWPLVARVNYAERFKNNAYLFEADAYPRLSKTCYLYLNAGYSDKITVFSKWRGGTSLFANLPRAYEAELGVRYLYYTTDIFFYTAYLGKYYKKFFFGLREYVTPSPGAFSNTTGLFVRYYYGGSDDYIHLDATRGVLVDERWNNIAANGKSQMPAYFGQLIVQKSVGKLNLISFNVSLYQQEFLPGITGHQYQGGIGFARRF